MIINKDKRSYATMSACPNTNFTSASDEDIYIVEDDSPLADKIMENFPNIDFVLDSNGALIDVTVTEAPVITPPPTLEEQITNLQLALVELYESMGG